MKVIVGLGNPGQTFHGTRHNVGFALIEQLSKRHHAQLLNRTVSPTDQRPAAVYGEYREAKESVRLLMPLTMMNESGEALRGLNVSNQDVLLVCDDVNLPLGTIRLRPQGSAGGHHGMQSCLEVLGSEDVPRLRIGVGIPQLPSELRDFVLSRFTSEERPAAARAIEQAVEACEAWIKEGMEIAMTRYNRAQDA